MRFTDIKFWKVFASLGVPGLTLGVFFILMRRFPWQIEPVSASWAGPLAVLFMILSAGVVLYALTLWRPDRPVDHITVHGGKVTLSQFTIDESQCTYRMHRYDPAREICPEDIVKMTITKGGATSRTIYGRSFGLEEYEEYTRFIKEFESQRNHYMFGWLRHIGLTPQQVPLVVDEQHDEPQDNSFEQRFPLFVLALTNDSGSQVVVNRLIARVHNIIPVMAAGESELLSPLATYVVRIASKIGHYELVVCPLGFDK